MLVRVLYSLRCCCCLIIAMGMVVLGTSVYYTQSIMVIHINYNYMGLFVVAMVA